MGCHKGWATGHPPMANALADARCRSPCRTRSATGKATDPDPCPDMQINSVAWSKETDPDVRWRLQISFDTAKTPESCAVENERYDLVSVVQSGWREEQTTVMWDSSGLGFRRRRRGERVKSEG